MSKEQLLIQLDGNDTASLSKIESNDLRRNTDNFSVVDNVGNFIVNKELEKKYVQYKKDGKNATFAALSAISEDIGSVIYENILNYIDNISNIDVCKVSALKSIAQELGIQYLIFDSIKLFPKEVVDLIDLFSIDVKYLQLSRFLNTDVFKEAVDEVDAKAKVTPSVPLDKSYDYYATYKGIYYSFYKLIKNNISATYIDPDLLINDDLFKNNNNYIYKNISADILGIEHIDVRVENLLSSKNYLNVPLNFNEKDIVDLIELGKDSIDNYTENEQKILKLEQENRANYIFNVEDLTYYYQYPTGKYAYYKEQKVKEFVSLVLNNHTYDSDINYQNALEIYDVDPNYFVSKLEDANINSFLITEYDSNGKVANLQFDTNYIEKTANILLNICVQIAKIRNELKNIPLKYYIRGTFLLLSYLINEYLVHQFGIEDTKVNVVEYYDNTEYFNLKSDNTKNSRNNGNANNPYFLNLNASELGDLETFYFDKLKMSDIESYGEGRTLLDFLSTIYKAGASDSYIDKLTLQLNIHSEDYKDDNFKDYNKQIFLKYNGNNIGYVPWYNHKNITHSSYLIHPCLYNFVQYSNVSELIKHTFNSILADEYLSKIVNDINKYIGVFGNILNTWSNGIDDFNGYNSRYEYYDNKSKNGNVNPLVDYDGLFYSDALSAFLNDTSKFISDLSTMSLANGSYYSTYYKHLGLQLNEALFFANLLSSNYTAGMYTKIDENVIFAKYDRVSGHSAECKTSLFSYTLHKLFLRNIHSYALDIYLNCYGLYKDTCDEDKSASNEVLRPGIELPLGQLWVKPKDHPIAFPMFGQNGLIQNDPADFTFDFNLLGTNTTISSFSITDNLPEGLNIIVSGSEIMNSISAIEFNNDLNAIAIAWSTLSTSSEKMPLFLTFGKIQKTFDNNLDAKFYKMYLNNIVRLDLPYADPSIKFDGFFKYSSSIGAILHKETASGSNTDVQLSVVRYDLGKDYLTTLTTDTIQTSPDPKISYVDNIINISYLSCGLYSTIQNGQIRNYYQIPENCGTNQSGQKIFSSYNDGYTIDFDTAVGYSPSRTNKETNTGVVIKTVELKVNDNWIEKLTTDKIYCQNDLTPGFISLFNSELKCNVIDNVINKTYYFLFVGGKTMQNDIPFPFGRAVSKMNNGTLGQISALRVDMLSELKTTDNVNVFTYRCTEEDYTRFYDAKFTYFKNYDDSLHVTPTTLNAGINDNQRSYYLQFKDNNYTTLPNGIHFNWGYNVTTSTGTNNTYDFNAIVIYVNYQFSWLGNSFYTGDTFFTNNKYLKLFPGAAGILDIVQYNTNNVISKYYIKNISDSFSPKVAVRRIL